MQLRKFLQVRWWQSLKLRGLSAITVVCLSISGLIWPTVTVNAGVTDYLINKIGSAIYFSGQGIVYGISTVLYYLMVVGNGKLVTIAGNVLIFVAQLNNFTNLPVIVEAWSAVRDLSNMFFIVILLVIAFGTLFRIEAYSWKKLLPKMILAAILVNYSRAICGVLVDASQVVMLTFVAAFKDALTVGLVEAFSLNKLLQFGTVSTDADVLNTTTSSAVNRMIAIFAAGAMLGNLLTVMLVYIVLLVSRLTMIWFLTVMSPLPFIANVLPQTEKYSSQWWEMFGRYVTLGPLMMFFLWLSLFIAAKSVDYGGLGQVSAGAELVALETAGKSELGKWYAVFDTRLISGFIIADMMLLAGLKMAQDAASEFSEFTSKAADVGKFITRTLPLKAGKAAGETGIDKLYQSTGLDLNVARQYQKIQHKRADIKRKREAIGYGKAFTAAQKGSWLRSWLGAADFAYEQYTPVLGKQGLLASNHPLKSYVLRGLVGNRMYNSALADRSRIEQGKKKDADDKLDAKRRQLADKYTTVGARDVALKKFDGQAAEAGKLSADGTGWNMSAGSEARTVLSLVQKQLTDDLDKATTESEARDIQTQLGAIESALKNKTGAVDLDMSAPGLAKSLAAGKANRLASIGEDRKKWGGKTTMHNGKAITTQNALNDVMTELSAAEQKEVNKINDEIKKVTAKINKYGPVIDYEGTQMQESVLAEERKKYSGEENEDVLRELLQSKFDEHDGIGALGVITHSAQVGHLNEMMDKMGFSQNVEGMQELAKMLQDKLGVDEQMVMAAMNDASKSAKHANHWAFAEAVTQRNGKYVWRDAQEREDRKYIEASKANMSVVASKGNRLAIGGYKMVNGKQVWQADAPMLELLAQALPNLDESARRGYLNQNLGEQIFTKSPETEDMLKKIITKKYGAGSDQERAALETMNKWKSYTSSKGRGPKDMYSTAEAITEETYGKAA